MLDQTAAAGRLGVGSAGGALLRRLGAGVSLERVVLWAIVALLIVLVLYPMTMLFLRSLQTEDLASFTLDNYREVIATPRLVATLFNSLFIAAGTTVLAVVFGVSLAWINARTNTPWGGVLGNLNLIPFFTPSFVGAIAWTILASRNQGLLNKWAESLFGITEPIINIYSPLGIIWVLALFETPLVYLFVSGAFRKMDPSLEEASRMAGAGLLTTTLTVTLPLALPSILSAALLIFVTVLGSFEVPLVLGIPARFSVVTTELYSVTSEYPVQYNLAAALCSLLLVVTAFGLLVQRRLILRRDYITVTGKAYRPNRVDIRGWRFVALGFNLLYLFFAVVLPLFALLVSSLDRVWTGQIRPSEFTLRNYIFVLFEYDMVHRALTNTLILAVGGATLATALGAVCAYFVFRTRIPGRGPLDILCSIPLAIPGAIMAMGVAVAWIRSPLYGTVMIMMVAYVARFTPYAQRAVGATLISISKELDECSRISGAPWWRMLVDIVFPLIKPGLVAAWLLLFIIFVRELGMSLFLYRSGTETLSVAIYLLTIESPTATAALCIIMILIILTATALLRRITREDDLVL